MARAKKKARKVEPWEKKLLSRIIQTKKKWRGAPVIKGKLVPLHVILYRMAHGETVREVCYDFNLTKEDVLATLFFAAEELNEKYYEKKKPPKSKVLAKVR